MRIASLTLLALCLAVVPAVAQTDLYDNGATNGTTDAWTINFGFAVSDTFTLGCCLDRQRHLNFAAWLFPGDVLESAEVSITSSEFGGTSYFDQVVNFTQSGCVSNQSASTSAPRPAASVRRNSERRHLLAEPANASSTLAIRSTGMRTAVRRSASESSVGTVPSESFTIMGGTGTTARPAPPARPAPARLLSPAASCCSVLASSAWLAFCAASCSNFNPTLPPGHFRSRSLVLRLLTFGLFFVSETLLCPSSKRTRLNRQTRLEDDGKRLVPSRKECAASHRLFYPSFAASEHIQCAPAG